MKIGFKHNFSVNDCAVRDFYALHWNHPIALTDKTFYEWQFIYPPENNSLDHCVIAVVDGSVVGVMGLNLRSFKLSGSSKKGAELTTWIINPDFSGRGLGAKMLNFLKAEFDVLIGMGITEQALPIYMKMGFSFLNSIPRFLRVNDQAIVEKFGIASKLGKQLIKKRQLEITPSIMVHDVDWLKEMDVMSEFNSFDRSAKSLIWRYTNHPYFKYHSIKVELSGRSCFVIFRVESCDDFKIMRVVDILGSLKNYDIALMFIDNYLIENNIGLADFFCTSSKVNSHLISSKWFSVIDDTCVQFPHLFQPIELRCPSTSSLVYWGKSDQLSLSDFSNMYISKSDADFDRPTMTSINQ